MPGKRKDTFFTRPLRDDDFARFKQVF